MRISDWSSDVCSSDLFGQHAHRHLLRLGLQRIRALGVAQDRGHLDGERDDKDAEAQPRQPAHDLPVDLPIMLLAKAPWRRLIAGAATASAIPSPKALASSVAAGASPRLGDASSRYYAKASLVPHGRCPSPPASAEKPHHGP